MAKWDHDELKSLEPGDVYHYKNALYRDNVPLTQAVRRDPDTPENLKGMLESRFRGKLPAQVTHCHKLTENRVVIFVVADGQPVIIEDGALFPSDTLITQLRLLQAGKKAA